MNANLYVKFDLTSADRERIGAAIKTMEEIVGDISKCYGTYFGSLENACEELQDILDGEVI